MASILFLSILSLALFFSLSSAHHNTHRRVTPKPSLSEIDPAVSQACKATRYPDTCQSSLTQSNKVPPNPTTLQIIQSSFWVTSQNLNRAQSMVKSILDSTGNPNRTDAANTCLEVLSLSEYRKSAANDAVPRGEMKDARAWMSAALAYQYDCWSSLKYANDTSLVNQTMSFLDGLIGLSSNTLAMIRSYDIYGGDTKSWTAPQTERDGFWESSVSGGTGQLGFNGGVPSGLPVDATVCVGGCKYNSVQDAVNAAPNNDATRKFVIRIKEGVYNEIVRIPFEKKNVVFIGDGMGKTVITGSLNVGQLGMTTYHSATVAVLGDGFMATSLTIQNTAGPDTQQATHQAVAFRSDSDLSVIENCEFLGNQDTLYAHSLRQFYKSCRIQGNVDFVFGNSASVFQDCQILVAPRQLKPEKGENNAVTAVGRTDPSQTTGFVFLNCLINGTEAYMKLYNSKPSVHKNYLGRPWKEYSRTVFIECSFEALITPAGWMPWSGDFALKTLYYAEYKNTGPGSDVSQRVSWSSQVPAEHVNTYSVQNFIQGDKWIQKTS